MDIVFDFFYNAYEHYIVFNIAYLDIYNRKINLESLVKYKNSRF